MGQPRDRPLGRAGPVPGPRPGVSAGTRPWLRLGQGERLGVPGRGRRARADAIGHPRPGAVAPTSSSSRPPSWRCQHPGGMWRTLLHDREAYLESSCTAMFGAALTKAVRLGLLPEAYREPAGERMRRARVRG
ncbi:MAG: glycoside hydrolase family 88 protein [Chloroflexota bacterium]